MCRVQDGERREPTDYLDQLTATRARSIETRPSSRNSNRGAGSASCTISPPRSARQELARLYNRNFPIYAHFFPPDPALFVGGVVVDCNPASANDSRKSLDTGSSSQVSGPALAPAAITPSPIRRRRPESRPRRSAHFLTGQALHC